MKQANTVWYSIFSLLNDAKNCYHLIISIGELAIIMESSKFYYVRADIRLKCQWQSPEFFREMLSFQPSGFAMVFHGYITETT